MKKIVLFLFLYLVGASYSLAQTYRTYLYKRVMIVKNGVKSNKNDDAHYITFNDKGCYESDKDGFTTNNGFAEYTKDENNLHCYYGRCSFGNAHYFFSSDYSRLNIRLNDDLVYVYQRELSGKTTANRRSARSSSSSGGGVYVAPPPVYNSSAGSGSSSGSSSSRSKSVYQTCKYCRGTGNCSSCNGKGHKFNMYGGYEDSCPACSGTGRCSICRGTGRL